MTTTINFISAVAALGAAIMWAYSAKLRIQFDESEVPKDFGSIALIDDDNSDILKTLNAQSLWSARAAYMAAVAALCQGIGLLL